LAIAWSMVKLAAFWRGEKSLRTVVAFSAIERQ
jgi:hypothetical protein